MTSVIDRSPRAATDEQPIILVVDDESSYRDALSSGLSNEGFSVVLASSGQAAVDEFHRWDPDVILLDVMLPDRSGIEICRELREESNVPIIMVSARSSEVDVVLGLELGASDYVAKPYRFRELIARIHAVLRRGAMPRKTEEIIEVAGLRLDESRREAFLNDTPLELSRKEFDLLHLLMERAGTVVTRDECIDALWWDQDLLDTRTLDTHVKRLRRKIERDPANPALLVTVRGVGFRFDR